MRRSGSASCPTSLFASGTGPEIRWTNHRDTVHRHHVCRPIRIRDLIGNLTFVRITIVTPAARGTRIGNRVTALRMASLLRHLGHHVRVVTEWREDDSEVLFALHARKCAQALKSSLETTPDRPRILVLTGTDVYGAIDTDPASVQSLEIADQIVVLQASALDRLSPETRLKSRVILQSARGPATPMEAAPERFDVCVIAHMREVKDPLLTARAARQLPPSSRIRVRHVGRALDPEFQRLAEDELRLNPRFEWLGAISHGATLEVLASSRLLVLTSENEGGPAVITEAIACGVPVLSTRIPAAEALLGPLHPGLFARGDATALLELLERCETNPVFLEELRRRSEELLPSVDPCREVADLRRLLNSLDEAAPPPHSAPDQIIE